MGSVGEAHRPKCNKIMEIDERDRRSIRKLLCQKPAKACITWIFDDGSGREYAYCCEHLDDKLRQVFADGIVTVQGKGRETDWELNTLIAARQNDKSKCNDFLKR